MEDRMRAYIDVTGKNEDEAIQKALDQLGLDRDDVSVEILERAKSGFLGFGSSPAKVRVSYGPEEEEEKREARPVKEDKPVQREARPSPAPAAEKPERPARQERPERTGKPPRPERVSEAAEGRGKKPEKAVREVQDLGDEVDDEKSRAIKAFLQGLLEHMECPAEIKVYLLESGRYKVLLEGQNMGALIGRRGETLDAIQQLTSYSVNRTGGRVRVQLDAEGYREKREQSLQHLARKVAGKVVKYHRSVTLEPMNAYERHVIHTALQDVPGVTTYSTGVDPNRRVIVSYDREKT